MKNNSETSLSMFYGASANIHEKARALRKRTTKTEQILWAILRNRQVLDLKFRRQHPIDIFIADFYCHEIKLVIEIDGGIHNKPENIIKDKQRTLHLELLGITVIRFTNNEVENNIENVIIEIERETNNFTCHRLKDEGRSELE